MAVDANIDRVYKGLKACGFKVYNRAIRYHTIAVKLGPNLIEITALRGDLILKRTGHRPHGVSRVSSWTEDMSRRDLTYNGLYMDDTHIYSSAKSMINLLERYTSFIGNSNLRI